jgi:hypothetical protein
MDIECYAAPPGLDSIFLPSPRLTPWATDIPPLTGLRTYSRFSYISISITDVSRSSVAARN